MPGLNLGAGAQVKVGSQASYGSIANPQTSTEAGFGFDGSNTGGSEGLSALLPNDPFGVVFWVGILTTGLLLVMYYSLPA